MYEIDPKICYVIIYITLNYRYVCVGIGVGAGDGANTIIRIYNTSRPRITSILDKLSEPNQTFDGITTS